MEATLEEQETFREGGAMAFANTFTGFILFAGIGLVLLFFVVQLISNPKKTLMSIVGDFGSTCIVLDLVNDGNKRYKRYISIARPS